MVLPDKEAGVDPDAAPFEIYTLDPRFSFVVRYNDLGLPTVMGVKYVERGNGDRVFGCYMSVIDTLIFDRTQADVDRVYALKQKILTGGLTSLTAEEKAEYMGGMRGAYNATDLNRVGQAVSYLADRFTDLPGELEAYPDVVMLKISETDYQREQEEVRAVTQRQNETAMAELSILVATLLGGDQ